LWHENKRTGRCRDLGIMPSHPLWRELQIAVIRHGGSLARL
jgi:hypothetical protein